jgi:phage-related protein (TIGR01555 family)
MADSVLKDKKSELETRLDTLIQANTGLGVSGVDPSQDVSIQHTHFSDWKLENIYLEYDLAKIIATEPATEATRNGWTVTDDSNQQKEIPVDASEVIKRAMIEANIYGGAGVIAVDGRPLDAPLMEGMGLKNAVSVSSRRLNVVEWEHDATKSGFDKPKYYQLSTSHGGDRVHASRVARFFGHRLPKELERRYSGFGQSKLANCWDAIRRMETVEASLETAIHRAASLVVKIAGLHNIDQQNPDDIQEARDAVKSRLNKMMKQISTNRAAAISDQEEMDWISPQLAHMIEAWQTLASAASRASRQPKTKLFGDTPAGLGTTDENALENWNKKVAEDQESYIEPALRMLYRVEHGDIDDWTIEFAALDEESEKEKAEKRKLVAQTDALYLDRGVRKPNQVAESRDGPDGWSMDTSVREDIKREHEAEERETLFDKLRKANVTFEKHLDADIPSGPYGSVPQQLVQLLSNANVQPASQRAREWVEVYNAVYNMTGVLSQSRETAMAVIIEGVNPWSGPDDDDLPQYVQDMSKSKREQWVSVYNETFDETESEGEAFRAANGVVKSKGDEKLKYSLDAGALSQLIDQKADAQNIDRSEVIERITLETPRTRRHIYRLQSGEVDAIPATVARSLSAALNTPIDRFTSRL